MSFFEVLKPLLFTIVIIGSCEAKPHPPNSTIDDVSGGNLGEWIGLEIEGGLGTLRNHTTVKFSGSHALLKQTFRSWSNTETLRAELTFNGLTTDQGEEATGSARIFLTPDPLPGFIEPYKLSHAIWFYIEYLDGQPERISLYAKANNEDFGNLLYRATLESGDLPLTLGLEVDPTNYRLSFNSDPDTDIGSRSGSHGLDNSAWVRGVRLGLRAVNHLDGQSVHAILSAAQMSYVAPKSNEPIVTTATARAGTGHVQVLLDPTLTRVVEGYDQIPRIFGATVNAGTRGNAVDIVREINLNSARGFLWPLLYWKPPEDFPVYPFPSPGRAAQFGGAALPDKELEANYQRFYDLDFDRQIFDWGHQSFKRQDGHQAQQAELFFQWGLTSDIVLHLADFDASARGRPDRLQAFFSASLRTIATFAPWLHIDFVQLNNEPDYSWFKWQFGSQREASAAWLEMFNSLDEYLRRLHPQTRLLGPCLSSTTMFSWSGWNNWTKPVLGGALHPIEHWNYNLYDRSAYEQLAWLQMLQAQAEVFGRPRPRAVVTEMNLELGIGSPTASSDRFLWWAQHLFVALEHPDKIDILSYFLLGWTQNYSKSNLLFKNDEDEWVANDPYWIYWVLRDLRGRSVYVPKADDSQLRMFASAPDHDLLTFAAFNDSIIEREIHVALPAGVSASSLIFRTAFYDEAKKIQHFEKNLTPSQSALIKLPPGAIGSLHWSLDRPSSNLRRIESQEYYSSTVAAPFYRDFTFEISVPALLLKGQSVKLRIGVRTDDPLSAKGFNISVNGRNHHLSWNEAPVHIDRNTRNVWWLEIPLEASDVQDVNRIVVTDASTNYVLMFASVVVSTNARDVLESRALNSSPEKN